MSEPMSTPDHSAPASHRLARALGRDSPAALTDVQLRDLELAQDQADHDAALVYGARGKETA
jgi:hypothetical protein